MMLRFGREYRDHNRGEKKPNSDEDSGLRQRNLTVKDRVRLNIPYDTNKEELKSKVTKDCLDPTYNDFKDLPNQITGWLKGYRLRNQRIDRAIFLKQVALE